MADFPSSVKDILSLNLNNKASSLYAPNVQKLGAPVYSAPLATTPGNGANLTSNPSPGGKFINTTTGNGNNQTPYNAQPGLPSSINITSPIGNNLVGTGATLNQPATQPPTPTGGTSSSVPPAGAASSPASDAQAASSTDTREIPCPGCTGNFLYKTAGRIFGAIEGFLQRTFSIRIPTTIISYLKERMPAAKAGAFTKGCPVCGGKGKLKDPSDDRAKQKQAASVAKSYTKEIEHNESKLGTGGNRYTIIQNHEYHEVGIGINDAPSYRVDYDAGWRNKGNAGPDKVNPAKGLVIPEGGKANHVQGLIPPMSPGGTHTIKCTNKFTLITGSHGIEFKTSGPVTIKGGITKIIGPEVTVGSSTGKLHLEGDVVTMSGRSVEVAPTDGHFYVRGTISNSGNLMIGGHAHLESASVVKLETTGRNECSKIGASSNPYTGPAFFGGLNVEGVKAGLTSLMSFTLFNATHPVLVANMTTPRYSSGMTDELLNSAYLLRPQEAVTCGFVDFANIPALGSLIGNVLLPVKLYPHVHALPDQMHVHETRIPDIKCDADTAKSLRAGQGGVSGPAPLQKHSTSLLDVLQPLWSAITAAFVPTAIATQQNTYVK